MSQVNKKDTRTLPPDRPPDKKPLLGTGALRGAVDYLSLPAPSKRSRPLERAWRIALIHTGNPNADVTGLELHDDVVLGRGANSEDAPDVDLSPYDAVRHGISRRHVLLRPTARQLFVIDLGSTNGTLVNAVPQDMGMARALKHNDTLSLGILHLTIKLMGRPADSGQDKRGKTGDAKSAPEKKGQAVPGGKAPSKL